MRLIIISIFLFLFSFSVVKITQFSTNDIDTFQLQGEIDTSGDIDQTLLFISFNAPSNYEFVFADGIITSAESNDIFKHLTNHIPSSVIDILQADGDIIISVDTNDDILLTPTGTGDVISQLGSTDNETHFGVHDSTGKSVMDVFGNGRVGIGTTTPNAPFVVNADSPGSVGGFPSGALHIKSPSSNVNANAVITGHNSFNGDTQKWYLGSASSANDNVTFLNRQVGSMAFGTANTTRLTIEDSGNVILENQIRIKGGTPGVNKILTSDAVGIATWEVASGIESAGGCLYRSNTLAVGTNTISLTFDTISDTLFNVTLVGGMGGSEFSNHIDDQITYNLEPQFNRTTGGADASIVVWYETSTDGVVWTKGEAIEAELAGGDTKVNPLTACLKGKSLQIRFRAQGTIDTSLEFVAKAAGTVTSDQPIIPAYILTID